jgi:hypothetical protein
MISRRNDPSTSHMLGFLAAAGGKMIPVVVHFLL